MSKLKQHTFKFSITVRHLKASGSGGTIGNVFTNAHAKYERNLKRENIREGQSTFRENLCKIHIRRIRKSPAGGEQIQNIEKC